MKAMHTLSAMLLMLCSGCFVVLPVPSFSHRVTSGKAICKADVAFAEARVTTRSEFSTRLGEPWAYYADLGVSVYCWETLRGYWFRAIGFGEAGKTDVEEITRLNLLLVKFDASDRFERCEILKHPGKTTTRELAIRWSGANAQPGAPPQDGPATLLESSDDSAPGRHRCADR
jgi:hypothetical protein